MTDIPVLGFFIQFFVFIIDQLPIIAAVSVSAAVPITLAALCGVVSERSGVVNIGLEGIMLTAAFVGWAVGAAAVGIVGRGDPTPVFGITPALVIGLIAALLSGMALAAVHAWLSISVKADQIVSGVIINIGAVGLTGYLNTVIAKNAPVGRWRLYRVHRPTGDRQHPVHRLADRRRSSTKDRSAFATIVLVPVISILLFRTRWGLRTRAVGEHPRAAETVGINVIALRYRNVILSGALAALGGAYLSMEQTSSFQAGMSAGRGFIGLAAMIVGRWTPIGAFGAALLFESATAVGRAVQFAPPANSMGDFLTSIPPQFYNALPYIVTIVVLAGVVGRSIPPAADGQPYEREAAA
jgi:simple sugar transport system permease protein